MSDIKEIIGDLTILWDLLKPTVSCHYLHFGKTEDILLKSGITTQIPTLMSTGRS